MAEVKYGQLSSWDDGNVSVQKDFMNLAEGSNHVRVITNPYQFVVHWVKDSTGANRKIRCAVKNCPLCKKLVKNQYRWYIGVLDRKSGQPKILEISQQIYKGIKSYISNPEWNEFIEYDWGKVMAYDLDIQRGPKGTNPLYTVMGSPRRRPLSDDEVAVAKEFFARVDISKFTTPPKPEEVLEKMGGQVSESTFEARTENVVRGGNSAKPEIKDEDFDFGDDQA